MRQRGLEGFVAAISPFNFTAIGGNLAYTPALMVRKRSLPVGSEIVFFTFFRALLDLKGLRFFMVLIFLTCFFVCYRVRSV